MAEQKIRDDFTHFYEEVGKSYPEEEVVYRDLRGKLRKEFILKIMQREKGRLLDIGCNVGTYLCEWRGTEAFGVDLSHAVLRRARQNCREKNPQLRVVFIVGDAQNLNFFRNIQFDFILCSEVLEHLLHPQAVFEGIAALLKPGGKALITTPNYKREKPEWIPLGELSAYVKGECYFHTAYRPEELAEMAREAGLQVVKEGTLEWQVKFAAKIPALILLGVRALNRALFHSRRLDHWNQRLFENLTLFFYQVAHRSGLEKGLRRFIREGVRSYVLLTRN